MASGGESYKPSLEFKEFTRKQMQHFQKMFKHYDSNRDAFIDVEEMRKMITKIGLQSDIPADPESMIREVDEDGDGKISLREFLLIFRKGRKGDLKDPALCEIYKQMYLVDGESQENSNPALKDFKGKIEEWSRTEEGTMI